MRQLRYKKANKKGGATMKKVVLIFGVSGFVGKYLAAEFQDHGYEVYGCDISVSANIKDSVKYIKCDILDAVQTRQVIYQIKPAYIVNLAAISSVSYSWKKPTETIAVNVEGTVNIFESVRQCNIDPKILIIGSSEEYEKSDIPISENHPLDSQSPYGLSKITQERFSQLYRERYGMKIYCVRSFNHTGVGQSDRFVIPSWCKQAAVLSAKKLDGNIVAGNIDISRDFSDVRDIVRAYRMILENEKSGTIYNVGSGNAVKLRDILNFIISLSPCDIGIRIDQNLVRSVDNPMIYCCNKLIKDEIGWQPQYDIFDTIKKIYQDYYNKFEAEHTKLS